MDYTEYYQLCLWDEDDRILMDDFNADNAKIDTALAAHDGKLDWLGNCRIETGSYTGTGEAGEEQANSLTFAGSPICVVVYGSAFPAVLMRHGQSVHFGSASSSVLFATVSNQTITWYHSLRAHDQMNETGITYYYLAITQAV